MIRLLPSDLFGAAILFAMVIAANILVALFETVP